MKFGVCIGTNVENMRYAKSLGYDFVEVHCQEIANKPIEHIEAMKAVGMPQNGYSTSKPASRSLEISRI